MRDTLGVAEKVTVKGNDGDLVEDLLGVEDGDTLAVVAEVEMERVGERLWPADGVTVDVVVWLKVAVGDHALDGVDEILWLAL